MPQTRVYIDGNSTVGTFIARYTAFDNDIGVYGDIAYRLDKEPGYI